MNPKYIVHIVKGVKLLIKLIWQKKLHVSTRPTMLWWSRFSRCLPCQQKAAKSHVTGSRYSTALGDSVQRLFCPKQAVFWSEFRFRETSWVSSLTKIDLNVLLSTIPIPFLMHPSLEINALRYNVFPCIDNRNISLARYRTASVGKSAETTVKCMIASYSVQPACWTLVPKHGFSRINWYDHRILRN